ncbi:MAG: apolipoprotein N-acyltransferase [Planctomycetaceae bacterium]
MGAAAIPNQPANSDTAGGPRQPASGPGTDPSASTAVSRIIDSARQADAPRVGPLTVTLLTACLLWATFFPLNQGWLGWVALVPLLMLVRLERRPKWMYRCVWLGGAAYWTVSLSWMRLGDLTMIPAWLALAFYLSLYFPLFLAVTRRAVHRLRVPLAIAAPAVWVGIEYLRSHLLTGFGWYLLGHSQWEFTTLIQMADLTGVYGITLLMVLASAAITELLPVGLYRKLRLLPPSLEVAAPLLTGSPRRQLVSVLASVLLFSAAVTYGLQRRQREEFPVGPRVTLVQGDFRSQVKHDEGRAEQIYLQHLAIGGATVQSHRPQLVIWPETMFPWTMLLADENVTDEQLKQAFPNTAIQGWRSPQADVRPALRDKAEQHGAAMIVGVATQVATPDFAARYNSAAFVKPRAGIVGRYDKLHRVPFGEFIPFQRELPFLSGVSAYGSATGLTAGDHVEVFELDQWRLVPLICFEDTVPHLVRMMVNSAETNEGANEPTPNESATHDARNGTSGVGTDTALRRQVDVLVNLTNDGWFRDSSEQEQHLVTALFRAIETRTPLVRAVNTGISAVIDGDGMIRESIAWLDFGAGEEFKSQPTDHVTMRDSETGRLRKSRHAAIVADVPLRSSLWILALAFLILLIWHYGDWLAAGCLLLTFVAIGFPVLRGRDTDATAEAKA